MLELLTEGIRRGIRCILWAALSGQLRTKSCPAALGKGCGSSLPGPPPQRKGPQLSTWLTVKGGGGFFSWQMLSWTQISSDKCSSFPGVPVTTNWEVWRAERHFNMLGLPFLQQSKALTHTVLWAECNLWCWNKGNTLAKLLELLVDSNLHSSSTSLC